MKQLAELKTRDYMSPQAIVVDDTARLTEAIRIMETERLSVLPVVDEQAKLVGILSSSDLLEITREIQADLSALYHVNEETQEFLIKLLIDQGENTLVKEVMTSPVITVKEDANMMVAALKMLDHHCHHLPIVDDTGKPIGVLSTHDFVRAFADHGSAVTG